MYYSHWSFFLLGAGELSRDSGFGSGFFAGFFFISEKVNTGGGPENISENDMVPIPNFFSLAS